jgi:hypothetical protein
MGSTWVENDLTFTQASRGWNLTLRDRYDADRDEILKESLDAWRLNPIARRIVGLTTQYVVGGGISVGCKHDETHKFIQNFWNDRLNRMAVRCYELCDELTRTGNLFVLISTGPDGMSYLRPVPAADIDKIDARPNDIEQPVRFWPKAGISDQSVSNQSSENQLNPKPYPAYDEENDQVNDDGSYSPVMMHYTINRPVGGQWGESDLAPCLKWLSRYSAWLEDRARLNRFRNAFLFVLHGKFTSEAERAARQAIIAANPPEPGSILVADESETWEVLSPKLESADAATDGLALKKMIASGSGIPLHFLAEPESATRTTAEAAGGPTYRHFEQRQNYFVWVVKDLLRIAIMRRAKVDHRMSVRAELQVRGADISARDNVSLSMAAQNMVNMLSDLRDRSLITNDEYLRMAYRFAGEIVDVEDMIAAAKKEGQPVKWSDVIAAEQQAIAVAAQAAAQAAANSPAGARSASSPHPDRPAVSVGSKAGKENDQTAGGKQRPSGGNSKIDPDTGDLKKNLDVLA